MASTKYIITIDLGGTNVKLALLRRRSKQIIRLCKFSTKNFPTKRLLFNKLVEAIKDIIANSRLKYSDILGIGIGVPGPVDKQRGLVYYFPNIPGWKNVALKKMLEARLKFPVFVDNDVNLMALAELKFGAAKNARNCICLTLGTGVGGALITNSSVFRGSASVAGEIGHIPISLKGPVCNCGGRGCLERFIGNKIILAQARRIFGKSISLEQLSKLARGGNRKALLIWKDMAQKLGIALSGLINVFNPELIVIGGGLANAGDILFSKVRQTVKERAMRPHSEVVKIVRASLGVNAGSIGASVLVETELAGS
ncbi:MAG: ROK family protein [Candidatus Omnitrophica bacterium]|nr:ROK family protein [Candidatus Omnitrophota bacterium]